LNTRLHVLLFNRTLRVTYSALVLCVPILLLSISYSLSLSAQESKSSIADESSTSRFAEGEELIFTVLLDKYTLGDAFAITLNGSVAYDFASFTELLDFPITFDSTRKSYNGWYIQESNTFSLQTLGEPELAGQLVINYVGQKLVLKQGQYTFVDDLFYLSEDVIEQVFGINFLYDYKFLQVRLMPSQTLPLLAKLAREDKQFSKTDNRIIKYANLPRSYELLSPQIFDFNFSSRFREATDDFSSNYSVNGARDIALLHANYSLTGNDKNALTNGRLTFSRESDQAGLFGALNATSIRFGDVRPVRQASGSTSQETRGFFIGNAPLSNAVENEVITLDGNVPIGWDVQILRNGILLDQQTGVQTGRYEFVDIPLVFGENAFDIILYGPQGQIQTRTVSKLIDRNILRLKGLKYEFSLNDGDDTLLGLDTINSFANVGYNLSGRLSYGLGSSSVAQLGYQSQFGGDINNSNIAGSLSTVLADKVLINLNSTMDDNKNMTFSSAVRTRLFGQAISAEYRFSDNFDDGKDTKRRDSFRLSVDGSIPLWRKVSLPYQNQIAYTDNGITESFVFNNRLSFYNPWFSLFNTLQYTEQSTNNLIETSKRGSLSLQKGFGRVFLRYANSYSLDNSFEVLNHKAEINWTLSNSIRTKFSLSHDVESEKNVADWQLGWFNDRLQVFGSAKYSDQSGYELGLNTRVSLVGQNSAYGNIHQNSRGLVNTGSIAVRVFDDINMNAVFDEGEQVIPGVEVKATQVFKQAITDSDGIAMLTGIASFKTSDVEIDKTSLPDPFLVPLVDGVSITFRKGLIDTLDFPMTIGSDIEGVVNFSDGVDISQGKNVIVELRNKKGRLIKSTKTESDGYYVFVGVLPGEYRVSIAKESILAFEIQSTVILDATITRNTEVLLSVDFNLRIQSYQNGFVTDLGSFSNLKMLNIYKKLLKQKLPNYSLNFFMLESSDVTGKNYVLSSFYTFEEWEAKEHCAMLSDAFITCSVKSASIPATK
jgi:hypothetical protein